MTHRSVSRIAPISRKAARHILPAAVLSTVVAGVATGCDPNDQRMRGNTTLDQPVARVDLGHFTGFADVG